MKQKHYKNLVLAAIILLMPMIGWAQTYSVTTLAGSGANGTANGTGTAAEFDNPTSAVVDGSGNIFVTDRTNDVIRKITPAGVVSTFAGDGTAGFANGTGTAAQFNNPHGIAIDASGNLYVADRDNHNIRKITSAGVVTTLAGSITGQSGNTNATGTDARFNQPTGVAVDASGNVFVTDYNNHRIRRVTSAGVATTFAGNTAGSTNNTAFLALFNLPAAIAIDASGNLYVADRNNHRIRKITTAAVVTTLAGSTNGNVNATGTAARFDNPRGIAVDASGNVYVADNTNNLIRMVTSAGVVTTLAGSGTAALTNGIGTAAAFDRPMGVAVDASGNIYVAEEGNDVIRKIYPCNLTTPTIAGATSFCSGSSTTLTTTYTLGTNEAYLWSDNSSASTLSVTAAGTYSLRIRNTVTGCTSSASTGITVSVTALPTTPTITGATAICAGGSTALTTTRTLLTNEAYLWSNGITTQSNTVSTAGTYTLRIRNTVTGCTSAASTGITVTVNALPTTPTITGGTSICTGGNTTLTTTATLGTNEAYLWSNGITTQSTTVSTAGTYSLRIRNTVTGCTSAVSNTITTVVNTIPTTPGTYATTATTACTGGSISLTTWSTLGTNEAYLWSNGATTQTINPTVTGSYTLRIRNTVTGCTSAASTPAIAVTVNPIPGTPTLTGNNSFCAGGGSTILTPGTALGTNEAYLWSDFSSGNTFSANYAGTFSLRIRNTVTGCTSAVSNAIVVTESAVPTTVNASGSTTVCSGSSIVLTPSRALGANEAYLWSDNSSASTLSVSTAGTYSVRVRNTVTGCTSYTGGAVTVSVNTTPTTPTITPATPAATCGTAVILTSSASAGNTYQWKLNGTDISGATASTFNAANSGNYTVVVVNPQGCTSATSNVVVVTVTTGPTFTSFGSASTTMGSSLVINGTNLTGTTSVKFGETPALFTVNSNTQITATVPKVASTGKISLSNSTGCNVLSTSITVTRQSTSNVYTSVSANFSTIGNNAYSTPTFTDLDGDGLIDMLIGELDGNLNHWEQSTANSTTFTQVTASFNGIDVGADSGPTFTDLDGDGLLDLIIGETDGNLNHYEQNSTNSTSFTLRTASFNSIDVGSRSKPTFTDLDGDGLLDMLIGEQGGTIKHWEQNAANSTAFTEVTASFNAIDVGTFSHPTFLDLDGDGLLDMFIGKQSGTIEHYEQTSANSTAFTLITNTLIATVGNQSAPTFTDIDGDGLLDMLVGEANGNLNHFEQNQSPVISSLSINPACQNATVSITGTALTGATLVTINGTTVGTLSGVTATNITFTVPAAATSGNVVITTPNGTSNAVAITITNAPTTPTIAGATSICTGGNTTLTTTATLGTNEAYLWSSGATTQSITVSTAATYSLRIRNTVSGCTSAVSNTITTTVNTLPTTRSITPTTPAATCGTAVTLTSSTSTGNTYQWKLNGTDIPGATSVTYSAAVTGNYTVVAVTPQGCSSATLSNTVAVTVNTVPTTATIAGATSFCTGGNTTLTTTAILGTNEAYLWSNGTTTASNTVSAGGTYSLRIRNTATGCTSAISNTITVTVNALPGDRTVTPATPAATCETAVLLTSSTSAGNTYQWKLNGVDIPEATSVTYSATTTGNYRVVAVTPQGCTSATASNVVAVTVGTTPTTPIIAGATSICSGSSTTLTTTATLGTNEAYLWSDNSSASTLLVSAAGTYSLRVRNTATGCTSAVSNTITVVVNTIPTAPVITGTNYFCSDGSTVLTSTITTGSYLWSNGATSRSITVTAAGDYNVRVITTGCTSAVSSNYTITSLPTGTWLGTTTDWTTGSNWCGGNAPGNNTDVTIGSIGLLPVITGRTATCRNLTLAEGRTLALATGVRLTLRGNFSGLGNIVGVSGSELRVRGSANQTIKGLTIGTLNMDNNNPNLTLTLTGNVTVLDDVALTDGVINTGSNYLMLANTTTNPTEIAASYITGNVRTMARNVGTGAVSMLGLAIAAGTDNLDTVMIERNETAATFGSNQGINHIWKIRAGNQPISGRQVTLSWNARADNGKSLISMQVYRRPDIGGEWIKVGGLQNGSTRSLTVTTNSFSDWTVSDAGSPLPVTWLSFTGTQTQFGNQLNWTTASELNNQGFIIERSTDGRNFTKIGFVKGNGTTNAKQHYQFTDSQLSEGYYRLQQLDFDGQTAYSTTIKVGDNVLTKALEVYPNPATDKVMVKTNGIGSLEIISQVGQVLITQPAAETNEINISKLARGVYTVRFNGASQKLVVR